jgi:hypothetical protein
MDTTGQTAECQPSADAYPPEVINAKTGTPATDIYLASGLMTRLIGNEMPKPTRRLADGCRYAAPRTRPRDAWLLLLEFDELLPKLYEPRT